VTAHTTSKPQIPRGGQRERACADPARAQPTLDELVFAARAFDRAFDRALRVEMGGIIVPVAAVEEQVRLEQRARRPKDLEDIADPRAIEELRDGG